MAETACDGTTPAAPPSKGPERNDTDELQLAVSATTSLLAPSAAGPRLGNRRPLKFEYLVTRGFLTRSQLAAATVEAKDGQVPIESLLMLKYEIPRNEVGLSLSLFYRCPFVPVTKYTTVAPELVKHLTPDQLTRRGWVPLRREADGLTVLTRDPHDLPEVDAIGHFFPGERIKLAVGFDDEIRKLIDATFHVGSRTIFEDLDARPALKEAESDDVDVSMEAADVSDNDTTIIRLANQIISDAHRERSSDIHIEPCSLTQQTVIRFRVDGTCFEYQRVPGAIARPLTTRFKIMAGLDIAERRKPQDGKIRVRLADRPLELRVATIPTIRGHEDVVLRLLAPQDLMPMEQQGLMPGNLEKLLDLIHKPYGLLLCVGPTGSGKTTTLHALLKVINTPERKIWTAEDPVEVTQAGLRQVQIRPKIGLTFAAVMRAFLRGDPDVIMVGEMRDGETASIGVEASLTGHLVLSTLHTNSAVETVVRLLDLGVDAFNFADALLGVLAQRLVKRLCGNCREPYAAPAEELDRLRTICDDSPDLTPMLQGDVQLHRARGCSQCRHTGYKGRLAIHELLVTSPSIKDRIYRKERVADLLVDAKKDGMTTLIQDGVRKVLQGITDLRAVTAVTVR